ncbi:hypothetical protein [Enterovirga sp. CN4-39]|uniref:hypothetical protein n=1 Tax=Enterovirga sp. CN4-39 TaxID=3400910 RepID=UPI003C06E911
MAGRFLAALTSCLLLGGCATVDYADLSPGKLSGSLFVMWVGEGEGSEDGRFLFVPDPDAPLTFRRPDPQQPGAIVKPDMMYTDGGSIPRIAQVFNGLSPWGYAPAYMIHDWLFVARHCLVDGDPTTQHRLLADVTFEDSAEILGEAIKGLIAAKRVKPNDLAGSAITGGVGSVVARQLWDARGACAENRVSAADRDAAEAAIPGSSKAFQRSIPGRRPARIVTRVTL